MAWFKKLLKCFFLILVMVALTMILMYVLHDTDIVPHKSQRSCDYSAWRYWKLLITRTLPTKSEVKVFEPLEEDDSISLNQCVMLKCLNKTSPICVYTKAEDKYISKQIVETGFWEKDLVQMAEKVLESDPYLAVLDLGCNIGVFTITAAVNGHTVIGVDPNQKNLRLLSKSLCLGKIYTNVTLIWNAVSNNRSLVVLHDAKGNVGGTSVKNVNELDEDIPDDHKAYAILLDDLCNFFDNSPIFIKMDIEGSEYNALQGGKRFLEKKNVKYILMEWFQHKGKKSAEGIINLLSNASFHPYSGQNFNAALKLKDFNKWPYNIFWKREQHLAKTV